MSDEYTGFGSLFLQFEGYLDGVLQGSLFHEFLSVGYTPLVMGNVIGTLNGIDRLIFYADYPDAQRSWLLDDFQYDLQQAPEFPDDLRPVPEPASLLLFGTGLAVLSTRLRKRTPGRRE